jgi:hypothetical protein
MPSWSWERIARYAYMQRHHETKETREYGAEQSIRTNGTIFVISNPRSNSVGTSSHFEPGPHKSGASRAGPGQAICPFRMAADPPSFRACACACSGDPPLPCRLPGSSPALMLGDLFLAFFLVPGNAIVSSNLVNQAPDQIGFQTFPLRYLIKCNLAAQVTHHSTFVLQTQNRVELRRSPFRSTQTLSAPATRHPKTPVISCSCRPVCLPWSSLSSIRLPLCGRASPHLLS